MKNFYIFITLLLWVYVSLAENFPVVEKSIPTIYGSMSSEPVRFLLDTIFTGDGSEPLDFAVSLNSFPEVAVASIDQGVLSISFLSPGQTTISIMAKSGTLETENSFLVGVYPEIIGDYLLSDFDDLALNPENYWNGSDGSGGFASGEIFFPNYYNADWGSWSQWAYSNVSDNTTPGWLNQHSAITGSGIRPELQSGSNYGIAYYPTILKFNNPSSHNIKGMFVTNNTYTALSMKYGDAFSKKFGGIDGNDPDWFRLSVWGFRDGNPTETTHFYLADFRFEDNTKDYIIETWQWLELSSLGKVDSLGFMLSSSDIGAWGMNTPAYFAVDNIYVATDLAPLVAKEIADIKMLDTDSGIAINLAGIFSDPDDDDGQIKVTILSNTNHYIGDLHISDGTLYFTPIEKQSGITTITLQALSNGKTVTTSFNVTVQSTVAAQSALSHSISVYPNPSHGIIQIKGLENYGFASIEIFSLDGRLVVNRTNFLPNETITLNDLPRGTYVMRIFSADNIHVSMIVLR